MSRSHKSNRSAITEIDEVRDYRFPPQFEFLRVMDVKFHGRLTETEWTLRTRQWDRQRDAAIKHMMSSSIWDIMFQRNADGEIEAVDRNAQPSKSKVEIEILPPPKREIDPNEKTIKDPPAAPGPHPPSQIVWKAPKMSRAQVFKFLHDWDLASLQVRDQMVKDFVAKYTTQEKVYDSDSMFSDGGSLIFCRFVVALMLGFTQNRKLKHFFDALTIFAKSMQSDRYTEEFMRLGGLKGILRIINEEKTRKADKVRALKFLMTLLKGRNAIAVKRFICNAPKMVNQLTDCLRACHKKGLMKRTPKTCGELFQDMCVESDTSDSDY